jgi:hypothetical protein
MGVTSHEYTACDDEDCPRFICRVYKEGRADGNAEGYQIGFADGLASCPGPHGG